MKIFTALALFAPLVCGAISCDVPGEETEVAEAAPMTLLARIDRSPTNVVSFYESESGIVIGETGSAEEMAGHEPLDGLRAQGMSATFRALARDQQAVVPQRLLAAELLWQGRADDRMRIAAPPIEPPPASPPAQTQPLAAAVDVAGTIQQTRGALGGLSTDAAWWRTLPICQSLNLGTPPNGQTGLHVVNWVDNAWCATDTTWAQTGWTDTMYYEATAFGQGDAAKFVMRKWVGGDVGWKVVINMTVAYRTFQTISMPPENGAFYYARVDGTGGQTIGISERYRYAMPQPSFINNKPNDVDYDFSNDLQGITHDANNWFITRTKYECVSIICTSFVPRYGLIAKVPLTQSLNNNFSGPGMPSSWNKMPGGGTRYVHFGDLVHNAGKLYVGMDGQAGAAVGVYDTNLNAIGYAPLSQNWTAPLIAYNPKDGYYYVPSSATTLEKYRILVSGSTVTATWRGTLTLSRALHRAQGAKFSDKGNLWMLTGGDSQDREFWGIDAANGVVQIQGHLSPGGADESEGLDIFDLDVETRPGMSGQLHLQLLSNDVDDDSWWFMHWRAPMNRL